MTTPLDLNALAREACGCFICRTPSGTYVAVGDWELRCTYEPCDDRARILSALQKAAEQARAEERERCAGIADAWERSPNDEGDMIAKTVRRLAGKIARAIRLGAK